MSDTEPQTADGKVLFHFAISLEGFVAGPNHEMDWMTGISVRPGLHHEYIKTTGAILGGPNGWDQAMDGSRPYGGAWQGPIFVLTHHPEDATPAAPSSPVAQRRRCRSRWPRPMARTSRCSRPPSAASFSGWD